MTPGEELVLHALLQNVFGAVWSSRNAVSHGQDSDAVNQAPASLHQISDVCSLDSSGLGPLLHGFMC